MDNKLWCDLKDDFERVEFLRSGRAWETGIIAKALQGEVADAFEYRAKNLVVERLHKKCKKITEYLRAERNAERGE